MQSASSSSVSSVAVWPTVQPNPSADWPSPTQVEKFGPNPTRPFFIRPDRDGKQFSFDRVRQIPLMPPNTFSLTVLLVPGTTCQTWWSILPHRPPLNATFPFLTSLVSHSNISQYLDFLLTASILCSFVSVVFLISLLVYLTGSFCVNHWLADVWPVRDLRVLCLLY